MRATVLDRIMALLIAAGLLSILAIAAWLDPSPRGYGTHEQLAFAKGLGLGPCTWVALTGRPCPTCGMTTAFSYAANCDWRHSFIAQPLGALLAFAAATGVWPAVHTAATGSRAGAAFLTLFGPGTLWGLLALLAGSWVYKIATWPGW